MDRWRAGAFTLIELLVVIAIIGMMLAVAAPSILGSMNASQLTAAGSGFNYKLSLAQQLAISKKQPVEVRLYSYDYDGVVAIRGYQLFAQTDAANTVDFGIQALEGPIYFGDGSIVVATNNTLTPLQQLSAVATTDEPWKSKSGSVTVRKILFYPDGSTNLLLTLPRCFLTLVAEKDNTAGTVPPPNYYTIQLDPVTGRTRSYRP